MGSRDYWKSVAVCYLSRLRLSVGVVEAGGSEMKVMAEYWLWNKIVSAAEAMKSEVVFRFNKDGIRIRTLGSIASYMMHLEVPASVFKYYEPLGEPLKLDVRQLKRRLRGDIMDLNIVTAEVDLKRSNQFKMEIATPHGHRVVGTPILAVEESDVEPPEVKKFRGDARVKVFAGAVSDAILDTARVDNHCFFEARKDPDRFVIWAMEQGSFQSSWSEFEEPLSMMGFEAKAEKVKTGMGLSIGKEIVDAGRLFSDVVTLEFADNFPIKFIFELPFEGKLEFMLAPWIEPK